MAIKMIVIAKDIGRHGRKDRRDRKNRRDRRSGEIEKQAQALPSFTLRTPCVLDDKAFSVDLSSQYGRLISYFLAFPAAISASSQKSLLPAPLSGVVGHSARTHSLAVETAREWEDNTTWTDGSRLDDGRVGTVVVWWQEEICRRGPGRMHTPQR